MNTPVSDHVKVTWFELDRVSPFTVQIQFPVVSELDEKYVKVFLSPGHNSTFCCP